MVVVELKETGVYRPGYPLSNVERQLEVDASQLGLDHNHSTTLSLERAVHTSFMSFYRGLFTPHSQLVSAYHPVREILLCCLARG